MSDLPDCHFGTVRERPVNWRDMELVDTPDDDEPLMTTPNEVTLMLGFDPLKLNDTVREQDNAEPSNTEVHTSNSGFERKDAEV